jgi:hypothetical protein
MRRMHTTVQFSFRSRSISRLASLAKFGGFEPGKNYEVLQGAEYHNSGKPDRRFATTYIRVVISVL